MLLTVADFIANRVSRELGDLAKEPRYEPTSPDFRFHALSVTSCDENSDIHINAVFAA